MPLITHLYKFTSIVFLGFILTGSFFQINILAQNNRPDIAEPCEISGFCLGGIENNSRYTSGTAGQVASNIIIDVAQILTFVAASIAIIFIIYQAFQMLTAQGDSKRYETALKGILYAIVGLVVSIVAYGLIAAIINVIGNFSI